MISEGITSVANTIHLRRSGSADCSGVFQQFFSSAGALTIDYTKMAMTFIPDTVLKCT